MSPLPRTVPLKAALFSAFLPIVVLPLLMVAAASHWRYQLNQQGVEQRIQEDLRQSADTRLRLVQEVLTNTDDAVRALALVWPEVRRLPDPNRTLALIVLRLDALTEVSAVSADGRVAYSSSPSRPGQSMTGNPDWRGHRAGRIDRYSPVSQTPDGRRLLTIFQPTGQETLVATYDTSQLQAAFRNTHAASLDRASFLVAPGGTLIAHSDERLLLAGAPLGYIPPVERALAGLTGTMVFDHPETGRERSAAYMPLPRLGWALVLSQPSAQRVVLPAATLHRDNMLVMAGALALAVAMTAVLGRRLARPIEHFSHQLHVLATEAIRPERVDEPALPATSIEEYRNAVEATRRLYLQLAGTIGDLEARRSELGFTNQQLEAAIENLKRLDHVRADFLNMVSHDLRIPLTAIIGYAELLEDSPELGPEAQAYLRELFAASERMQQMLEHLLDFARLEAGRIKLNLEPIDLTEAIPEAVSFFKPLAQQKHLDLDVRLPQALTVMVDRDRLSQMLNNLISNAIKYTPEGGTVTIRACEADGAGIFEVEDTGVGLTEEDKRHLFEKFYRSPRDEVQREKGSGLGLALVKGVIEAHGGTIEAEGAPGHGARFRVGLPLAEQPARQPHVAGQP